MCEAFASGFIRGASQVAPAHTIQRNARPRLSLRDCFYRLFTTFTNLYGLSFLEGKITIAGTADTAKSMFKEGHRDLVKRGLTAKDAKKITKVAAEAIPLR